MKLLVLVMVSMLALQSCLTEPQQVTELDISEQSDRAASARAFKNTVHPLLVASCAGCHGDGGSQAPKHAVSNHNLAHDAVVDTGRVNFMNPGKSRLVLRLSEDRHYCWSDCQSDADQMLSAIEAWKAQSGGLGGVSGKTTGALQIADARDGMAETINGTIVLQAEDGDLSGRFKVKIASEASGLRYIAGDQPGVHPIEATQRAGVIDISCNNTNRINNTINGPYRLFETQRHVNQSGYIPYSSRIVMTWIDPAQRDAYEDALRDPNITDYSPYYFRDGDGDLLTINSVRVLPEFVDQAFFNGNIRNITEPANQEPSATYTWQGETNLVFDFFKPRFGASGTEYFFASSNDVIDSLPDYVFRDVMYQQISNRIRGIFEGANTLADIPDGMRLINGSAFNFSDKANQVDVFHDHFMAELTGSAAALGDETGGVRTIDRFVHYEVPVGTRDTYEDVNWNDVDVMNISDFNTGVELDLAALFTGGSVKTVTQIRAETYETTLKTVFTGAACVNCHGDGSNRPQFANANNEQAYNAAAAVNGFINFANPRNARPVERMLDDRHNCGGQNNCDNLGNMMISALGDWENAINAALAAQANSQDTGLEALSLEERTPGKASYPFRVTEAGEYNVWFKLMAPSNQTDRLHLRILDSDGNIVRNCSASTNGVCGSNANQCRRYESNTRNWEWYTPSINNENNRVKWDLSPGTYTLEVYEDDIDLKIDLIAINKNPEFNPAKNLIDEGFIQDLRPKTLRYDLSSLIGGPGFFEIDVKQADTQDSYVFRNPRFVEGSSNFRFRNIKVLVNGSYELSNSTYSKLDRVTPPNSGILTYTPLVVLEVLGLNSDDFAFVFEDLQRTSLPASQLEEDAPVPVEGRKCLELGLFEQSVMPILNQIRLVLKDEYIDYTENSFPGTDGNTAENMTFYTCTTCHNEEHPYFKMTTFFDNSEVLCEQALSRVDFGNFERSLLLRGINGTFNHPKLHFIQDVVMDGSGTSRRFRQDSTDASGFASTWRGNRLLTYTVGTDRAAGEINLGAYSGADRAYLEQFVGTFQRIQYQRYINVQSPDSGDILTENGSYSTDQDGLERYNQSGSSVYTIRSPEDYLNNQNAWDPNNPVDEGEIAVDRNCMGEDFLNNNGTIIDPSPCGNSGDYTIEFENIKSRYRDAVINWMDAEKRAYQNQ